MSKRNDILNGLVAALKNISVTNGFKTNPSNVVRSFIPIDRINTFPVLMVFGGNEQLEGMLDGETYRSALTVKIRGVTLDKAEPEQASCDLIGDVLQLLESGYNPYKDIMMIHTIDTDEGWYQLDKEGSGFFEIGVDFFYTFNRSAP